jgi:radical SAM superfamily enzyme YgiQ (UPF0313 family)
MKILLYFPNFKIYQKFNLLSYQLPLGLGYLASALEKNGFSYEVLDAAAENYSHKEILQMIKIYKPNFIAITTNVSMVYSICVQAKLMKKFFPEIPIIMGGPWATVQYNYILSNRFCDYVVIGEGEITLIDFLNQFRKNEYDFSEIPGLAYISNGKIIKTRNREFIHNLDLIGYPNWNKFPIFKYDTLHRSKPFFPIITSRGCPFDCINCTKVIHGYEVRYRSVENIISELKYLKDIYNCKEIQIMDDVFNFNLPRAKNILKAIISSNFDFKINLMNGIRADYVDEEFVQLLHKAGVYRVGIGIESGSTQVIKFLKKKLDLSKLPQVIKLFHKYRITTVGYFIFGLPIETPNSMIYSIDFADKLNIDLIYFFKMNVFPGTKLYDYLNQQCQIVSHIFSPKTMNYHTNALDYSTKNFTQKDIDKVWKYYFIRFYLNPKRLIHFLKIISYNELLYTFRRFFNFIMRNRK